MIVLRKTMDAAVEAERAKIIDLARTYGDALRQIAALQKQLGDWITDKGEQLTPEQFAALFYSHDDTWQAAFFNVMQSVVQAHHDAMPPVLPNEYRPGPGYPAGEGQWCWMADKVDDSGFETLEAMFEHVKHVRTQCSRKGCYAEMVTTLDGDRLCQEHASEWARGEGQAAQETVDVF